MLPKQHRLTLRNEFSRLKKTGRMIPGYYSSLLFAVGEEKILPRFAFIVSKKIDNRATVRNRVRRLLSEAVYQYLPNLKPGTEGVFLVKKSIKDKSYEEIKKDVNILFSKARINNNE